MKQNVTLTKFGKYNVHAVFKIRDGFSVGDDLVFDLPSSVVDANKLVTRGEVESIARDVAEDVVQGKMRRYG